jgi:hypothetical protein
LFVLKSSQSSLYAEAELWLGSRPVESADASRQTFQRGQRVVRRLYLGPATAAPEGWEHLRTVGALVVALLRRLAYTLLTLFRSVTQRSDERRSAPWKRLMLEVFTALLTTNEDPIRGLRIRPSS